MWRHDYGELEVGTDGLNCYAHVDRIGFRVPDTISALHANRGHGDSGTTVNGGLGKRRLQRSLTPHLDCCPTAMHDGGGKEFPRWRPVRADFVPPAPTRAWNVC